MKDVLGIAALVALTVVVLVAMRAGWHRRAVSSAAVVPALAAVPADLGTVRLGPVAATYVSTTVAGDWLDRVVAHDLGVRSAASVSVTDAGVLVARTGARDLFVPAADLVGAGRAPGMAGKVVGGQGLVVLRWRAPSADGGPRTELETGLRTRRGADRAPLTQAVDALVTARSTVNGSTPDASTPDAATPDEERT